jgi:hypothetical protein
MGAAIDGYVYCAPCLHLHETREKAAAAAAESPIVEDAIADFEIVHGPAAARTLRVLIAEKDKQRQAAAVAQDAVQSPPSITKLVHDDLYAREQKGIETYGTTLKPFNGRDALWDAYEEALDLAQYLRQAIFERDGK